MSATGFASARQVAGVVVPRRLDRRVFCGVLAAVGLEPKGRCVDERHALEVAVAVKRREAEGLVPAMHLVVRRATSLQDLDGALAWTAASGYAALQLDALQLSHLEHAYRGLAGQRFRGLELILQLNRAILVDGLTAALELADRLRGLAERETIHVLLDRSGGKGVLVGLDEARELSLACRTRFPALLPALAGGLAERSVEALLREVPFVSVDAESALFGARGLGVGKLNRYLRAAARGTSAWRELRFEPLAGSEGSRAAGAQVLGATLGTGTAVDPPGSMMADQLGVAFRTRAGSGHEAIDVALREDAPYPVELRIAEGEGHRVLTITKPRTAARRGRRSAPAPDQR